MLAVDHRGNQGLDVGPVQFGVFGPGGSGRPRRSGGGDGAGAAWAGSGHKGDIGVLTDNNMSERSLDEASGRSDAEDRVKHGVLLQTRGGEGPKE